MGDNQNHDIRKIVTAPAPPPPPGIPRSAAASVLRFTATVAGTLDDFDAVAYANALALFAGVSGGDVSVAVAAASVLVTARIYFATLADAESVAGQLDSA